MLIFNIIKRLFFKKYRNVYSNNVAFNALQGKNIRVLQQTYIDYNSHIGDYTFIGRNCEITRAVIGRYCSIASYVQIGMGEHDFNSISLSSHFTSNKYVELTKHDLIIGHDVWIGAGCLIKRGVKIGNGAIVGANSFVNKDVPDFAVVAGSPAKIIRYRFDIAKQDIINKSNWWYFEKEKAKKTLELLNETIDEDNII